MPGKKDSKNVDWGSVYLFAGTHGHVVALDKRTGGTVWDTSLPSTGYDVVAIVVEDEQLLCASGGRVFCLDPLDGRILWTNPLKGLGTGLVYLTTAQSSGQAFATLAAAKAAADAAAAAGSG